MVDLTLATTLVAIVFGVAAAFLAHGIDRRLAHPGAGALILLAASPFVPRVRIIAGISLDDVLPVVAVAVLVLQIGPRRLLRPPTALRDRPVLVGTIGLVLLALAGGLSAVTHAENAGDLIRLALRSTGRNVFLGVLVGLVSVIVAGRSDPRRFVARALAIAGTVEAIFGTIAFMVPLPDDLGLWPVKRKSALYGDIPGRLSGTLGLPPNFVSAILMATAIITVGLIVAARTRRERIAWSVALAIQFIALTLTFTRSSLGLGVVGMVLVVLVASRPILLVPMAAGFGILSIATPILRRIVSDVTDRLALWTSGFLMMLDNPLFGVGPGGSIEALKAFPERYRETIFGKAVSSAHNTVLLAGATLGVIGAVGALLVNIALVWLAVRAFRTAVREHDGVLLGGAVAVLGLVAQGMVNNLFTVGATSTYIAFIAGAFLIAPVRPVDGRPSRRDSGPRRAQPEPSTRSVGPDVSVLIVQPADPRDLPLGGISTFIRGFVKYAPADLRIALAGIITDSGAKLGAPLAVRLEEREIDFYPVARASAKRRTAIPVTVPFVLGLLRHRGGLPASAVLQFHRPLTALPLLSRPGFRTRVVHLTTGELRLASGESRWRYAGPVLELVERVALGRMGRIYVVNPVAAEQYRRRFPGVAHRLVFVPNWVDDDVFHPPALDQRESIRAEVRAQLGLDPRSRLILFAGRLEAQKDPLLFIDACSRIASTAAPLALIVAGDGTLREVVEAAAKRLESGRVARFLGTIERPDLARLMQAADSLVITSRYEAGPTVGLEALGTGLPVVTTDVGLVADVVRRSGAGRVAGDRLPSDLAKAVASLLDEDPEALRAKAEDAARPFHAAVVLEAMYADIRNLGRSA